jgi:hypothetical protein
MAPIAKTDYYFLQSPKSWYSNPLHESSIIVRSSSFCNTFLELDSLGQGIGALTFDLVVVHEHFAFPVNRYVYNRKAPAPRRLHHPHPDAERIRGGPGICDGFGSRVCNVI